MFVAKLKLVTVAVVVATALGVSGLAYRASGPAAAQAAPQGDKGPSELEVLRHKVELLQTNLDVLLEKVRAQEAELKSLRAQAAVGIAKMQTEHNQLAQEVLNVYLSQVAETDTKKPGPAAGSQVAASSDPLAELEAALRTRRGAADPDAARQADVEIQRAVDKLRGLLKQAKPAAPKQK
jgi:hypothetical protein